MPVNIRYIEVVSLYLLYIITINNNIVIIAATDVSLVGKIL